MSTRLSAPKLVPNEAVHARVPPGAPQTSTAPLELALDPEELATDPLEEEEELLDVVLELEELEEEEALDAELALLFDDVEAPVGLLEVEVEAVPDDAVWLLPAPELAELIRPLLALDVLDVARPELDPAVAPDDEDVLAEA